MTNPKVLSGKDTAIAAYESFKSRISLLSANGITPGLCVVLVGEDPASQIYVRTKTKKLKSLGLKSEAIRLEDSVQESELISIINDLNNDKSFHGILVQMPLPKHINSQNIINAIKPEKRR